MKTGKWTEAEVSELNRMRAAGTTLREIAKALGRTVDAVKNRMRNLDVTQVPSPELPKVEKADFWRAQFDRASARIRELEGTRHLEAELVNIARTLAPTSYAMPPVSRPKASGPGTPQPAVLMLSDTHVGKVVRREQTLGFGEYNMEIFLRRLHRLERSIESILRDHTTTDVPEIVVAMLGDMIDGGLTHSAEAAQAVTKFSQFYQAGHALAQCLTRLSALAPLRIYTAVGNHTRWGEQHKMPTKNRFSNLDQFLYAYVEALTQGNKRIKFNLDEQPYAVFKVAGSTFYAGHGDHLKGGDRILGIPSHAIGRHVSCSSQTFARAGLELPNYYLFGDKHKPIEIPHAVGKFIINGAFTGLDEFATVAQFTPAYPCQRFFLMHPRFGQTASYDLRLDLGDGTPHPYSLPKSFPCP